MAHVAPCAALLAPRITAGATPPTHSQLASMALEIVHGANSYELDLISSRQPPTPVVIDSAGIVIAAGLDIGPEQSITASLRAILGSPTATDVAIQTLLILCHGFSPFQSNCHQHFIEAFELSLLLERVAALQLPDCRTRRNARY